ncbi:MAG: transporter substrate-binding domain-containing protein [Clostridiales bacterium]
MKYNKIIILLVLSTILSLSVACMNSGIKIGVTTGTTYEEEAKKYKKVSEVKTYKDDNLTLKELSNGRLDGIITDKLVGLNGIKKGKYDDLKLAGDLIYVETIAVAIHKENDSLRQAINKALEELISSGEYEKISEKYFDKNILDGVDYVKTYKNEEEPKDDSLKKVKEKGEISFAMSGGYPPFNYYEGEELTGFDVEVGKAIAELIGVKYKAVTTDWSGILTGLKANRYDGIFGSMAITEERKKEVDFTNPYYFSGAQLIVPKDSDIESVEDLKE